MSEVRHRRGELTQEELDRKDEEIRRLTAELEAAKAKGEPTEALEEQHKEKLVEEIARALNAGRPNKVKGLSNTAKQYKDRLAADPFNMELIFNLGLTYAEDGHWDKSANVLLRGWKRAQEFEDPATQYHFLICLAEASMRTQKYRQALAVMNDIREPDDEEAKTHFELMRCQIYCENGDMQKGLKALNKAIEGKEFEKAAAIWANCLGPLKKAGAYDMSKSTMLAMATTEEQKAKLEAMEKLAALKEEFYGLAPQPPNKGKQVLLTVVMLGAIVVLIYLLYLFEAASLSKIKKG